jgi:hypothetical protein
VVRGARLIAVPLIALLMSGWPAGFVLHFTNDVVPSRLSGIGVLVRKLDVAHFEIPIKPWQVLRHTVKIQPRVQIASFFWTSH